MGTLLGLLITLLAAALAVYFALPEGIDGRRLVDDTVALQAGHDGPVAARGLDGAVIDPSPFARRAHAAGWMPVGIREDTLHGRAAVTVVWQLEGHRLMHTRLSGSPVGRPEGSGRTGRGGVLLFGLPGEQRNVVTWTEMGTTAVVSGRDLTVGQLYDLAGGPPRGR